MVPVCYHPDRSARTGHPLPTALVPGSFNPLHDGHRQLARVAERLLGGPVAFELSVANVDKPDLTHDEISERVAQFAGVGPVWVTRAARFVEKAKLFPGAAFILGHDTAVRLIDARYYADATDRDAALRAFVASQVVFVVGGRLDATGAFRTWDVETVAAEFHSLFVPIPEAEFRADISSTQLRTTSSAPPSHGLPPRRTS